MARLERTGKELPENGRMMAGSSRFRFFRLGWRVSCRNVHSYKCAISKFCHFGSFGATWEALHPCRGVLKDPEEHCRMVWAVWGCLGKLTQEKFMNRTSQDEDNAGSVFVLGSAAE
jgi:hypothetical protein